ncbi:MAG: MurR/RpiR family transcriptional regulator [Synergistaceae bacterium]|nr:MurR/RpiR family transcriptional regulator [Synergistaceae bacterium]NLV82792.1 MurR/RpiR family transcriptional regulator [Synergistaceae bacterium]
MDSTELKKLLMEKSRTMPNKARRVTEYLLSNMREASFKSIGDVADELEVSKAQLVRVAQMLGFSGYAELKGCLQNAVLEQINPAAFIAREVTNEDSISERIFRAEHANIDDTMSQLKDEDIDKFCKIMKKANNIYFMGWGISSLVVELFQLRLVVMGCKARLLQRGSLSLWEQVRSVKADDALVVGELPSYALEVTEAVEITKKRGAKIITITDSAAAPVCRFADLSFFVSAASPTFGSSIIGPLFLAHVLTSELAESLGYHAKTAFEEQEKFLRDERIFHPTFGLKY